jgi:hypothetical protein
MVRTIRAASIRTRTTTQIQARLTQPASVKNIQPVIAEANPSPHSGHS